MVIPESNDITVYVQIFEGHKFHEFRGRQHFCEILVLHIRILNYICENIIMKKDKTCEIYEFIICTHTVNFSRINSKLP